MKLMAFAMAGFLLYVFFAAWFTRESETVLIDVRRIAPGEVKFLSLGKRRLLILHRSPDHLASLKNLAQADGFRSLRPDYFVAWAYDPVFGCDIDYQQQGFHSVCVNNTYDLAGRLVSGVVSAQDLRVPQYQYIDADHIRILVNE